MVTYWTCYGPVYIRQRQRLGKKGAFLVVDFLGMINGAKLSIILSVFLNPFFSISSFFPMLLPGAFKSSEVVGESHFEAAVEGVYADQRREVFLLGSLEFSGT